MICRQLGFPGVVKAFHTTVFGQIKYVRTWLTNINCIGNETKVTQCASVYGWGNPSLCDERDQVGVQCQGIRSTVFIGLTDLSITHFFIS